MSLLNSVIKRDIRTNMVSSSRLKSDIELSWGGGILVITTWRGWVSSLVRRQQSTNVAASHSQNQLLAFYLNRSDIDAQKLTEQYASIL